MTKDGAMPQLTEDDLWEGLTVAERKEIPLEDFAWPDERKYPVDSQDHLDALAKLIGRAPEAEQPKIKARAIAIAKRKGFTLPDTWKDEEEKQESTASIVQASMRPQKKIATLPISWLEYNARSLNERIYPKATCDAIFASAQREIAKGLANLQQPPTTYTSHEDANGNVNLHLVGGPVKVWQEGNTFWSHIDLADTSTAHDIMGLVEGGYLKSGSMRVSGVQLLHDPNYDMPLVVPIPGMEVKFLGIDLTTRPGLSDVAHIPQVLYESNGQEVYSDAFMFGLSSEGREEPPAMTIPLFIQVALGVLHEAMTEDRKAHQRIHDHLSGVLDATVGARHGAESARLKALIEGQLDEAGKAIAMKHAKRLAAAHDESAKRLGYDCEGVYNDLVGMAPSDTDNDGDDPAAGYDPDHDGESQSQKGKKIVTEAEMFAALKAKGYAVEPPKTEAEKQLAALEARIAEQDRRIAQLTETAPTTRQTLATPSQMEESTFLPEPMYEDGDYLKGDLHPKNWKALKDRRVPWPKGLDPRQALHEMAPFLAQRLLNEQYSAQGRSISDMIGPNEDI